MFCFKVHAILLVGVLAEAAPHYYSYYGGYSWPYYYGGYGLGYGHYVGKRSADAQPDAEPMSDPNGVIVGGFPYGNGYAIPTYPVYTHLGPYGGHVIAKRDAEAKADPQVIVGSYPYGNGYALPYFGHYYGGVPGLGWGYYGKK